MTTYLGKRCSFCLPRVPFVNCRQFMYLVISLFGFEGRIWDLIVSVPDHCLSFYFVPTQIDEDRLKVFSVAFERAVHGRLKSKNPVCSVYVDLDIYRYLFGDVSSKLCDLQDFTPLKLSDNWFYILNRDGTGKKLKFPIKLTARLCIRKM